MIHAFGEIFEIFMITLSAQIVRGIAQVWWPDIVCYIVFFGGSMTHVCFDSTDEKGNTVFVQ